VGWDRREGETPPQNGDIVLQLDDPLCTGEGHALGHQAGECGDVVDLDAAVAPLSAAGGAGITTPWVSRRRMNAGCMSSSWAAWLTV